MIHQGAKSRHSPFAPLLSYLPFHSPPCFLCPFGLLQCELTCTQFSLSSYQSLSLSKASLILLIVLVHLLELRYRSRMSTCGTDCVSTIIILFGLDFFRLASGAPEVEPYSHHHADTVNCDCHRVAHCHSLFCQKVLDLTLVPTKVSRLPLDTYRALSTSKRPAQRFQHSLDFFVHSSITPFELLVRHHQVSGKSAWAMKRPSLRHRIANSCVLPSVFFVVNMETIILLVEISGTVMISTCSNRLVKCFKLLAIAAERPGQGYGRGDKAMFERPKHHLLIEKPSLDDYRDCGD